MHDFKTPNLKVLFQMSVKQLENNGRTSDNGDFHWDGEGG